MKRFLGLMFALALVFSLSGSALAAGEISPSREELDPGGPTIDVPDEGVPLVAVPDADVPLADVPDEDVPQGDIPTTDIPDTDVPLVSSPQTGSTAQNGVFLGAALTSVSLATALIMLLRKKEQVF